MQRLAIGMGMMVVAMMGLTPVSGATTWDVEVGDYYFRDADGDNLMSIPVGDTVRWTNVAEQEHEVECHAKLPTGAEPVTCPVDFEADLEEAGSEESSFAYTFTAAGVYLLHCNLGGDHNLMKQVIVVA